MTSFMNPLSGLALGCASGAAMICASLAVGAPAAAHATVPNSVTQLMTAQHLPSDSLSFVILDPDTGGVVMSHNPDTPRSPASTIKTVTTYAALDMLGPTYAW